MIRSIVLEIEGNEIVIPMSKAKELYDDLFKLFGKEPRINYPIHNPLTTEYGVPINFGMTTKYGYGTSVTPVTSKLKEDMSN